MAPYLDDQPQVAPQHEVLSQEPITNGAKVATKSIASSLKSTVTESDIISLRELLATTKAGLFAPQDDGYEKCIQRWSRAAEKPAGVAVVPTTAEEVSIALKYASEKGLDVAVKGGGHSSAGASSTDGGMLIDLSKMKKITVDKERHHIHIEGGCQWGEVDNAAWEHGLATVGGTVADTGVGGLVLGGGYGMLTGERGLVIDNLVKATVVLSSGEIVQASKEENADLFWALRGAGHNFGVTTEFVLQAYPQGDLFLGTLVFPPIPETIKKLVELINDLYTVRETPTGMKSKGAGKTMGLLGIAHQNGHTGIIFIVTYNGPEHEAREIYKPFFDLGPVHDDTRMAPYPTVNNQVPAAIGMRCSMKGAAYMLPIRDEFVLDVMGRYNEFLKSCPEAGDSLVAWELMDPTKVCSSDEGCFANRGFHLNSVVMPMWRTAKNDQHCRQWAREVSLLFKEEIEHRAAESGNGRGVRTNKGAVLLYGNYDQYDEKSRDILGDNYPRLQQIKAKYDPTNVFNKLFAITPRA